MREWRQNALHVNNFASWPGQVPFKNQPVRGTAPDSCRNCYSSWLVIRAGHRRNALTRAHGNGFAFVGLYEGILGAIQPALAFAA